MVQNKQLSEYLKGYADDAEVIIISTNEHVRHVGMTGCDKDGKYKVVLASEPPTHCCKVCGENVYRANNVKGYYCPTCMKERGLHEITKLG